MIERVTLLHGHCVEVLRSLPADSVHCCVTSPPYWGLRDYGLPPVEWADGTRCCLGLEPTPELFITHTVEVFREVRRVLRPDGTLWLNIGDSYAGAKEGNTNGGASSGLRNDGRPEDSRQRSNAIQAENMASMTFRKPMAPGLKPKDLIGMPWRVALALQQPYTKPNKIKREADRAWLAAFMDGEGCISIRQQKGHSRTGEQCNDGFVPFLCATNNDKELLDHCLSITGCGRVALKDTPGEDARGIRSRRDSYGWRVESLACVDILVDIYPFLIAKKKQAILAYNLTLSNQRGRELRGNGRLPQSEQERRAYLKELVNRCNQRQPVDIPSWCEEPKQEVEPGWWLRCDIVWSKANPMPESVRDRPTRSHEFIFLLAKSERYFYDADAVREPAQYGRREWVGEKAPAIYDADGDGKRLSYTTSGGDPSAGRNLRSVWHLPTQPYAEAHFATYPEALVQPCIKAGTSEHGCCPECGAPWRRLVEPTEEYAKAFGSNRGADADRYGAGYQKHSQALTAAYRTTGWEPTCDHGHADPVPCTVLDCFGGSGTTAMVAAKLGRLAIHIDQSAEYIELAKRRLKADEPGLGI